IMIYGLGQQSEHPIGISNLCEFGGFLPTGIEGIIPSLAIVMFSFGGIEVFGITASEDKDPEKTIRKAINALTVRILLFYVL
ncbi:proline-specific permease ProY, partial [Proteus mirabilis]|nr:proline-specific permease ProY [Proteus mirabilis]